MNPAWYHILEFRGGREFQAGQPNKLDLHSAPSAVLILWTVVYFIFLASDYFILSPVESSRAEMEFLSPDGLAKARWLALEGRSGMGDAVSDTDPKELNNFLVRGGRAGSDGMVQQQAASSSSEEEFLLSTRD